MRMCVWAVESCLEISVSENMLRIQVKRNHIEKCKKRKTRVSCSLFSGFEFVFFVEFYTSFAFSLDFLKRAMITLRNSLAIVGFSGSSAGKECTWNVGDLGSIPGLGRSPGEGNVYILQYSCLENFIDRGAWWATVHGVTKSQIQMRNKHFLVLKGKPYIRPLLTLLTFYMSPFCISWGAPYSLHTKTAVNILPPVIPYLIELRVSKIWAGCPPPPPVSMAQMLRK